MANPKVVHTKEESHSSELGIFHVGKHTEDSNEDTQAFEDDGLSEQRREKAVMDALMGCGPVVCGFRLRPIRLSAFALLRQVNSAYLVFVPLLTSDERKRLMELSKLESRNAREMEDYVRLNTLAIKEAQQLQNPFLDTMVALLLLSEDTSAERAMELAYGPVQALRQAAYEFGDGVAMDRYEELSRGISNAIQEAQITKVVPVPEKGAKKVGNGSGHHG